MTYYDDIYSKRLNRFGCNYQSRIQGQREKEFELYLRKSVYQVGFVYNNFPCLGVLEPYKQDENSILAYLLVHIHLDMPPGTILQIADKNGKKKSWMIWWLESMKASGYNRYLVLQIEEIFDGLWGYFEGPHKRKLRDTLKSGKTQAYYTEDENLFLFITPVNVQLKKNDYLERTNNGIKQAYVITGIDATEPGLMYISMEPVYTRDNSDPPVQKPTDNPEDFYWLNGGELNGGT